MALHDDLLRHARDLVQKNSPSVTEADLRRSVSSAYYALFHLLIFEACANWSHADSRNKLSRMFEHPYMKKQSNNVADMKQMPYTNEDPTIVGKLRQLARIFSELQDKRHEADYDTSRTWSVTQAEKEIESAEQAFRLWNEIRNDTIAQEYLILLLIKPRN